MIQFNIEPVQNPDLLQPARAEIGVSRDLWPETGGMMGRFFLAPAMRSRRQYLVNADLALFIVEGQGALETGPAFAVEKDTFESKDFIFIERGEVFSIENTGGAECSMVFTLVGVEDLSELNQMFVEGPLS
ncbi:cupin domain-containing protein [Alphaproteobacteria bacterium KMM 3653]|uniref:Cupin domain-containing protein n=1 Tax=Harenicola maris TaxID=2841044 RepID=A0AAP2CK78_9RHOB|nr:cupin domain-containing protein [Harenicola maris]